MRVLSFCRTVTAAFASIAILASLPSCGNGPVKPTSSQLEKSDTAHAAAVSNQIVYSVKYTESDLDITGGYWRLAARVDVPDNGMIDSDKLTTNALQVFIKKIKEYLWTESHATLLAAKPNLPETGYTVPAQKLFSVSSDAQNSTVEGLSFPLTQWYRDTASSSVTIYLVRSTSANTHAVTATADVLQTVVPLFSNNAVLSGASKGKIDSEAKRIDLALNSLFSLISPTQLSVPLTPFNDGSPGSKPVQYVEVFVQKITPENRLFTTYNDVHETLLSSTGKRSNVAADSQAILNVKVSLGGESKSILQTLADLNKTISDAVIKDTPESLQIFCGGIDSMLDRIGLVPADRMAVEWAYLSPSSWARKASARPDNPEDDLCQSLFVGANLTSHFPKLQPIENPKKIYGSSAEKDQEWNAGNLLRSEGVPRALQSNNVADWTSILSADYVTVTAVNAPVQSNTLKLDAKGSQGYDDPAKAAEALASLSFSWLPAKASGGGSCFERLSAESSRAMMRARSSCVKIGNGTSQIPVSIVFVADISAAVSSGDPKKARISEIRLWSD